MSIHDFKLHLNSADGVNQDSTNQTQNSYLKYNYDFSKHKHGYYSVRFTYIGDSANSFGQPPIYPMALSIQFPYLHNYRLKDNSYTTSQILGYCYPQILTLTPTGILYADLNTNGETVISLPLSNGIIVNTLYTDSFNYWVDGMAHENVGYNLVLYFKYIGNQTEENNERPNVFESKLWNK